MDSLSQGIEAGFTETKAALGPILAELATLGDGIANITASLSAMYNQPDTGENSLPDNHTST